MTEFYASLYLEQARLLLGESPLIGESFLPQKR